jgi:hypothetical protein
VCAKLGRSDVGGASRLPRTIILLAACFAIACSASTRSRATEPAPYEPTADSIRSAHADVDLTGVWASGSTAEPAARQIAIHPECNHTPALWVIQQRGDSVRAWSIPESYAKGTRTVEPVVTAAAEGRVSGVELSMGMTGARYLLHYDSTSGHLRGTLNGAPFWAVRQEVVRPGGCIAIP